MELTMRKTIVAVALLALPAVSLSPAAPQARADCTSAGGTTICSQGDVRGADTGDGPSSSAGPWVPYACGDNWYACDDYYWGIDVDFNPDFDRPGGPGGPGGPDIGRPGRPGGGPSLGGGRGGRR